MSRTRRVTTDDVLDAAERVVVRLGAVGLSIDAVAQEAGISKSRVVYDFKTKAALLEALVDRQMNQEMAHLETVVKESAATPHPELFARLKLAEHVPDELEKAIVMMICASMSSEEKMQQQMREYVDKNLQAMEDGARPRAARMAYFALMGFGCTEWFNLHQWTDDERRTILDDIRSIYTSFSENPKS